MVALPQLPRVRRSELQPYIAEFFGVILLVILGDGVIAQVLLSDHQNGSWLSINFAWAVAVALTAYVSSPSPSVNPAVSIVSAIIRPSREQWRQLPGKLLAQFFGGFVGAAIVYFNYRTAIRAWDPEHTIPGGSILSPHGHHSAGIFSTYPASHLESNWEGVVQEALGAAVLMFGALAIGDDKHGSKFGSPVLGMFLLLLGIGTSLGWQTGYAVNPARDFGPRLFTAIIYGREVFTAAGYYCFVPLLAPVLGCFIGAVVYDAFLFDGEGSAVTNAVDRAEERFCNPDGELRLDD